MKQSKWLCMLLVLLVMTAITFSAKASDYSFLDSYSLEEMEALQKELEQRITVAKAQAEASDTSNYGMWELQYFVDEFKLPTDEGYIINKYYIQIIICLTNYRSYTAV